MSDLDAFLKRAGWKPRANAWASKSGRQYRVLEEVAPGAWDRSVAAFLAKAILQAQAGASPEVEAVAALRVKRASPLTDSRLAKFVDEVAPRQSWILLDSEGRVFPHVVSAPELNDAAANQVVKPSKAPAPKQQQSLFTDLNQWMLKVLLAPLLPEKLLTAPRGRPPRNPSTLAEVANVSLPAATRFLHALEGEGQLDTRFGDLRIARPLELLPRWRDRMGHPARRELAATSVRGPFNLALLASVSRLFNQREPPLVLGLHSACAALELGHVAGAAPVVWTSSLDTERLEQLGLLPVEKDSERFDVVLRVPRYPATLFRGVVTPNGTPVTDVLQCWLDTSHYRIRGQEQADFLWRRILKPAFTS